MTQLPDSVKKSSKHGNYIRVGETTWPAVGERASSIDWKLRYQPETLTREDQLFLASIVSAYCALPLRTQKRRNEIFKAISAYMKEEG